MQKAKYLLLGMAIMLIATMCFNPVMAEMVEKQINVLTGINIYLDDKVLETKDANGNPVEAFIFNGTTYLPARAISQAVGQQITWDGKNNSVYIGKHTEKKQIKVLSIGNSFSDDAQRYLHDIAAADGVDLFTVNLYIGGCSLETHWKNISEDAKAYTYKYNGISTSDKKSIKETLESDDWDYITLQQASTYSGDSKTYYPYIEDIAKYVHGIEPNAKFLIHQTWAYEKDYNNLVKLFDNNHEKMYSALKAAYNEAANKVGEIVNEDKKPIKILPVGTAVQYARANLIFDSTKEGSVRIHRDGTHLNNQGRYLAGLVWYQAISGNSIDSNTFKFEGLTDEQINILKDCAQKAVLEYGWNVS